jgi:hypothetical protein
MGAGIAAAVGTLITAAAFCTPGSPLYQSTTIWQVYNSLIGAPLGVLVFERLRGGLPRLRLLLLDAGVLVVAVLRMFALVPLVSGHTSMMTFVALTSKTRASRFIVWASLVPTLAIKLGAWHQWASVVAGIGVGVAASAIHHRGR